MKVVNVNILEEYYKRVLAKYNIESRVISDSKGITYLDFKGFRDINMFEQLFFCESDSICKTDMSWVSSLSQLGYLCNKSYIESCDIVIQNDRIVTNKIKGSFDTVKDVTDYLNDLKGNLEELGIHSNPIVMSIREEVDVLSKEEACLWIKTAYKETCQDMGIEVDYSYLRITKYEDVLEVTILCEDPDSIRAFIANWPGNKKWFATNRSYTESEEYIPLRWYYPLKRGYRISYKTMV